MSMVQSLSHLHPPKLSRDRWDGLMAGLACAAILAFLFAWPGGLLDKADHAAYAVCHRISERSFSVNGRALPLCARCSGTYLGVLAGLIVLAARGRGRARQLPPPRYLAVLGLFVFAWACDGLNSYLTLFPVLPHLYRPHNLLRLVTGTLEGLALSAVLLPVANLSLWRPGSEAVPSLSRLPDLLWMLAGGGVVVAAVSSEWPPLLYPLALSSGVLVVGLVGIVNAALLLAALQRDGRAGAWGEVAAPLLLSLALALAELTAIGALRAALTQRFGLPF